MSATKPTADQIELAAETMRAAVMHIHRGGVANYSRPRVRLILYSWLALQELQRRAQRSQTNG